MKKAILLGLGLFVVLGITFSLIGLGAGWFNKGVEKVSPAHVEAMYSKVITSYNGLVSSAQNACAATKKTSTGKYATNAEDPALAYGALFNQNVADYNSTQQDIFKAGIVGPAGYPKTINVDTSDWCTVASQVKALKH